MNNSNKNAFPSWESGLNASDKPMVTYHQGLTKREYFAGLVLQGILANNTTGAQLAERHGQISAEKAHEIICGTSLKIADELLKQLDAERDTTPKKPMV